MYFPTCLWQQSAEFMGRWKRKMLGTRENYISESNSGVSGMGVGGWGGVGCERTALENLGVLFYGSSALFWCSTRGTGLSYVILVPSNLVLRHLKAMNLYFFPCGASNFLYYFWTEIFWDFNNVAKGPAFQFFKILLLQTVANIYN